VCLSIHMPVVPRLPAHGAPRPGTLRQRCKSSRVERGPMSLYPPECNLATQVQPVEGTVTRATPGAAAGAHRVAAPRPRSSHVTAHGSMFGNEKAKQSAAALPRSRENTRLGSEIGQPTGQWAPSCSLARPRLSPLSPPPRSSYLVAAPPSSNNAAQGVRCPLGLRGPGSCQQVRCSAGAIRRMG
jgi:hypothetical protein